MHPEVGDISTLETRKSWTKEKGSGDSGSADSELFIGSSAELAPSSLLLQGHGNKCVTESAAGWLADWRCLGHLEMGKALEEQKKMRKLLSCP